MRDDLHGQVLFIAEAIGLALDDANGVVQPLDATERDFVVGPAVRNDAVPMTFDHLRELLKGFSRCHLRPARQFSKNFLAQAPLL